MGKVMKMSITERKSDSYECKQKLVDPSHDIYL